MMEFFKKHTTLIVTGIILISGSFFIGLQIGRLDISSIERVTTLQNKEVGKADSVDFSAFWKTWNILNEKFVSTSTSTAKKVDDQQKVYGAISGLAKSYGDPYTTFFPPTENKIFESDIRGNFEGVGMEIGQRDGVLTVVSPIKGSPAYNAGIHSGDKILKINDKSTLNMTTEGAVDLIRGKKGTVVTFSILREGKKDPFNISVTRDVIDIPTINTKKLPGGIFDIELYSFSAQSPNLFRGALREFIESGDNKMIIDLRGNPGGYLEAAIDKASWFLPTGKVVVRESFGGNKEETIYRSKGYDIFNDNLKLVILVDGGSASASEILAGALSEHGVATLVGEKTFGKGSVQELIKITDDTSLKVTIARWLTPNGVSISASGLVPKYEVKLTEEDVKNDKDPQLEKAIEILNNK